MGIFDKAKDFASKNPDKADMAVDKAGDMVDERTGGKYAEHIDKGQDMARGQYGGGQADNQFAGGPDQPADHAPGGIAEGRPGAQPDSPVQGEGDFAGGPDQGMPQNPGDLAGEAFPQDGNPQQGL